MKVGFAVCFEMSVENVYSTVPNYAKNTLKPGQLDESLIAKFFTDGYLMVPRFFDIEKDLEPCKTGVERMVDELAQKLYKAGKISDLYEEKDLFHRLTLLNKDFPGSSILLHKMGNLPKEFMKLWTNEKLLNVIEQLIGPEIAGNPVWNLRPKVPNDNNQEVPWHQDASYFDTTVENVLQITAWIPLTDANETNGCLQVLKGGHRVGKVAPHLACYKNTWQLYMDLEKIQDSIGVNPEHDCVTVPVPYGGMLLFSNVLPHRSLPNQSEIIRWSLDLRFQNPYQSYGYHGVKNGLVFRSENHEKITDADWDHFNNVDRNKFEHDEKKSDAQSDNDEFEPIITPFFAYRWPIINENQHTAKLKSVK